MIQRTRSGVRFSDSKVQGWSWTCRTKLLLWVGYCCSLHRYRPVRLQRSQATLIQVNPKIGASCVGLMNYLCLGTWSDSTLWTSDQCEHSIGSDPASPPSVLILQRRLSWIFSSMHYSINIDSCSALWFWLQRAVILAHLWMCLCSWQWRLSQLLNWLIPGVSVTFGLSRMLWTSGVAARQCSWTENA